MDIDSEFYNVGRSNASGYITVFEGYKKAPDHNFTVQSVATWSENEGLEIPQSEKYERRSNLSGVSLDIAAVGQVCNETALLTCCGTSFANQHCFYRTYRSAWSMEVTFLDLLESSGLI